MVPIFITEDVVNKNVCLEKKGYETNLKVIKPILILFNNVDAKKVNYIIF